MRAFQEMPAGILARAQDIQVPAQAAEDTVPPGSDRQSPALGEGSRLESKSETAQIPCRALVPGAPLPEPHGAFEIRIVHPGTIIEDLND